MRQGCNHHGLGLQTVCQRGRASGAGGQGGEKGRQGGARLEPRDGAGAQHRQDLLGKAWCDNLEAYSDFENRLPRGRTYVRNGSVVDLQIQPGKITARVTGSELYQIVIDITALPKAQWQALVQDCTGSIATLVELLQGKLSQAVMERMCKPQTGMFPAPRQIKMACSCPDWAGMCKHVAARSMAWVRVWMKSRSCCSRCARWTRATCSRPRPPCPRPGEKAGQGQDAGRRDAGRCVWPGYGRGGCAGRGNNG
jgi:hypothetical protein